MKKNVLVVFGGYSSEHDVSIVTAVSFLKRNCRSGYNLIPVYIDRGGDWFVGDELTKFSFYRNFDIKKLTRVSLVFGERAVFKIVRGKTKKLFDVDFAVNCCHGGVGENGNLTALFESCGIPNSNGSVCGMGIAMNKKFFKYFCLAKDLPTIDFFCVDSEDWNVHRIDILRQVTNFDFPVVVKPCSQGSSVGVSFAENFEQFEQGMSLALKYDNQVVVERAIKNKREFNCCVLRGRDGVIVSEIDEPISEKVVVTFEDKYLHGRSSGKALKGVGALGADSSLNMENAKRKFPAEVDRELRKRIQEYSLELYLGLEMNGVVRIDYIFDTEKQKLYVGEVNAIPGSLGYYFFKEKDFSNNLIEGSESFWKASKVELPDGYKIFS